MAERKLQGPSQPIGRDTQGNYVFPTELSKGYKDPSTYLPPKWFGGGGSSPSSPSGPSQADIEAERKRQEELRKAEEERKRVQEEVRKAREEKIEAGKISGQLTGEQKETLGKSAVSQRWEIKNGKSVLSEPYSTIKKNIGESEAAFNARARSFGGAIAQESPVETSNFFASIKEKQEEQGMSYFPEVKKENVVVGAYNKVNKFLRQKVTEPTFSFIEKKTGFDLTKAETQNTFGFSSLGIGNFGLKPTAQNDIIAGVSSGILTDIKEKPAKNIVLYGAGAGLGFGVGATITGISKVSPAVAGVVKGTSVIGGLALGGAYAYDVGKKAYTSNNLSQAGGIIGVGAKDIFVLGSGYKAGNKGFDIVRGIYNTRGRTFIDVPQGEYPSANPNKQLNLFKKNIYTELGDKPGAFHTTGNKFWEEGLIKPNAGTSELPGLYGSTQISTPFSRIQGSSSSKNLNIKNYNFELSPFQNLQNFNVISNIKSNPIFAPVGSPGVAFLQPEGFRSVKAGKGNPYYVGEQKFIYGFDRPAKPGYADVPGIKSEIEAIFRINAGDYLLSNKGFYTKIKGVRVPIDSFVYGGKGDVLNVGDNFLFNPKTYNLPAPSSSVPSGSFISLVSADSSFINPSSSNVYVPDSSIFTSSSPRSINYSPSYRGSSRPPSSILRSSAPPSSAPRSYINPTSSRKPSSRSSSSKSKSNPYSSSSILGSSSYSRPPKSSSGPLYKSIPLRMKSKPLPQIFNQRTAYQPSFTSSALGITSRSLRLAPGGLSNRPIITGRPKKKIRKRTGIKLFDNVLADYL